MVWQIKSVCGVCGLRRSAGQFVLDNVSITSSYTSLLFCRRCLDLRVHKVYLLDFHLFDDRYQKKKRKRK
jgi:hypothetical protein